MAQSIQFGAKDKSQKPKKPFTDYPIQPAKRAESVVVRPPFCQPRQALRKRTAQATEERLLVMKKDVVYDTA